MLILYYKPTCPFCQKVLNFTEEEGIHLQLRDIIADPENAKTLVEQGGKRQVPYLIDEENDVAMYESDDIIEYLRDNHNS